LLNVALFWAVFRQIRNKIDALRTETESVINFGEMSLSAFSPAMTAVALLSTLSWSGFIVSGFMLWATGNMNGGYSMVGIAICLPAVIAAVLLLAYFRHTDVTKRTALMTGTALLSVLSWIGFIVAGFMLWAAGNTDGGYSMVGIAICLPAAVAALVPLVARYNNSPAVPTTTMSPHMTAVSLLSVLSWVGFIVAGFVLWATGNTNGGYSMVGIAICLPAAVAAVLALAYSLPVAPAASTSVSVPAAAAPAPAPAPVAAPAPVTSTVVVDSNVVV